MWCASSPTLDFVAGLLALTQMTISSQHSFCFPVSHCPFHSKWFPRWVEKPRSFLFQDKSHRGEGARGESECEACCICPPSEVGEVVTRCTLIKEGTVARGISTATLYPVGTHTTVNGYF